MRLGVAAALLVVASTTARADDDIEQGTVIFARGGALYRVDSRGRGEKELAKLPDPKAPVRALRSDARGTVLLANVGGAWLWMPLDGSTTALAELTACEAGPAQLAEDGACVLCKSGGAFAIVNLATGKTFHPKDAAVPHPFVVGTAAERHLIFADAGGIWSVPMTDFTKKQQLAPAPPLRGFLPSPDGARAVGVYNDTVYTDARHTKQADVLDTFQLDGTAARRKAIKDGVALEWSHDATWVLVQDGAKACIMRAVGGQYKCWNGYTAASLAPDGRFALILGSRTAQKPEKKGEAKIRGAPPKDDDDTQPVEPDVAVAPPTGPLSLYRARLEGAYTDPPVLLVKVVDGAAVWVPQVTP